MSDKLHGLAFRPAMACVLTGLSLVGMADAALALDHPSALALDAVGNLYVADAGSFEQGRNGDISIYSVAVNPKGVTATLTGTITSNIKNPYSVAVSPFGKIYAGNLGNSTITVYGPDLAQTATLSANVLNMFVDGNGDLFFLDNASTLHTFLDDLTPTGALGTGGTVTAMSQWGSNVTFWGRYASGVSTLTANMGVAVHGSAAFNGNFPNGSLLPSGVAQDSLHQQYATNSSYGMITVYSADFSHVVATFAGYGSAIAIDSARKLIYTAAPSSSVIFIYSLKSPYKYLGQF